LPGRKASTGSIRVVNHYGGLSTYKVGTGELQRVLLEDEGISFRADGTIDLKRYQWRPGLKIMKKLGFRRRLLSNGIA
jgi:alkylated DNA nucleotide flippase Atl1